MDFTALIEMFLQVVEERRLARLGAELQRFADALDEWLHKLFLHPCPEWREQWQEFLVWQEAEGRRPTPESQRSVVAFLEAWEESIGWETAETDRKPAHVTSSVAGESSETAGGYLETIGPGLAAIEEERRRRDALAMPPLVDGPPEMTGRLPQIVEIKKVRGFWALYDEAVATGQFEPNQLQRALAGLARQILPESEASTLVKFDDGTVLILLGGGANAGDLSNQATFFLGAFGAARGVGTLKEALSAVFGHLTRETAETIADTIVQENTGLPVGPSGFVPKKGRPPSASASSASPTVAARQASRDRSWTSLIEGKAQTTGSKGHRTRIYREAIKMAKSGQYDRIWLNRAYSTTTGTTTVPRRLPDIIARRKTGQFDAVEVPSTTDDEDFLRIRNLEAMKQLPEQEQGEVRVSRIRKTK